MNDLIRKSAEEISDKLIEIRRSLHRHPETAFEEYWTHDYVCEQLEEIEGLNIQKNKAKGTGIIATMEGLLGSGKTILLRGDMDALPVTEEMGCEYSSEIPGCMHACGHDAHTAWLIGAAMILSKTRHLWGGTVKFMFQPAEEIGAGARVMIEQDGILENPNVDFAFAAHVWPGTESGKIGIPIRYAFGSPGRFWLKIKGRGGHGAMPETTIDPIAIANEFYLKIPSILTKKMKGTDSKVVSVTYMLAGEHGSMNVIPNSCEMGGTMRSVSKKLVDRMAELMEQELKTLCDANGAEYEFGYLNDVDSVKNSIVLIEPVRKMLADILGEENVELLEEDNLVGEDFSQISTKVPALFLMPGIASKDNKPILHNSDFQFDDHILSTVSAAFAKIVIEYNK